MESRAIAIPSSLAGEERARFVQRISAGVRQQAGLAAKSDAVLRVEPDVIEQGDLLIVRHEPASSVDVGVLLDERPALDLATLWWLSVSTIRALKAAAADGAIHGGIQPGTVYRDATGRIKLGDFGIASAIETVCGIEQRRQIHLDSAPQKLGERSVAGVWSLLDESETRDRGWIAPFFGHELLEGRQRLNAKSDQFALGAVLYMLATGSHPYGADVADPGLNFYMFVEPASLADERKDWAEAFERRDKGLAAPSDNPLFGWQALIVKLLHSDPGERFANPAEAEKACSEFIDAAWAEAAAGLQKADTALKEGDPEGFLSAVGAWRENERLPSLWRSALSATVGRVSAEKERIVKARKLDQQLKEAEAAIEAGTLENAQKIAQGIVDSDLASDAQRQVAHELIRIIDEQQQILVSGADELAREYLETAAKQVAAGNIAEARQTIDAVLSDPATPSTRQVQARHLLAELNLAEQRREQQAAEISLADAERKAGQYDAAVQRLENLLATDGLEPAVSDKGTRLLQEIRDAERQRNEFAQALDEARNAWESADLKTLESRLAVIPEQFDDETIAEGRADLLGRARKLRTALAAQAEAEKAISVGGDEPALAALDRALHEQDLPQRLLDALHARRDECQKRVERARRELIDKAVTALESARAAFAANDFSTARTTVEKSVLGEVALPAAKRRDAEQLLEACQRVDRVNEVLEACREHISDTDVDSAERLLESTKVDDLPKSVVAEVDAVRRECVALREKKSALERAKLAKSLDDIEARIAQGQFEDVESDLKKIAESGCLDGALKARLASVKSGLDRLRPMIKSLAAAEKAIKESAADFGPALAALNSLAEGVPDWLARRRDSARAKIEKAEEQRRAEAAARAVKLVDAAQSAVEDGDAAAARERLAEYRAMAVSDAALTKRIESIAAAVKLLEAHQPKIEAARTKLAAGDIAGAIEAAAALAKDAKLPAPLVKAAESIVADAKKRIAARRGEIEAELNAVADRISQKGKRDRGVPEVLARLKADPLVAEAHRKKADELAAQYAALPEPKSRLPLIAAIVAVVVVAGGAGYWFTRPKPPPTPAELIASAQSRLNSELQSMAQRAGGENRETPAWVIEFSQTSGFPTSASAKAAGQTVPLGEAATADGLAAITLASRYDDLFKKKPEIPVSERVAATLNRLTGQLARMKSAAGSQNREIYDWTLTTDQGEKLPVQVLAKRAGAGELALGEIGTPAAFESFSIENRLEDLFPEKKPDMQAVIAAGLAQFKKDLAALATAAAADPQREKRTWTLAFDRPEPFPVTLTATREGDTKTLGTFENAAAFADFKLADKIDILFPKMVPKDAEVIKAQLARLNTELTSLAAKAAAATNPQREKRTWTLTFDRTEPFPVTLKASRESVPAINLATFTKAGDLEAFKLESKFDTLFPPMTMPTESEIIAAGLSGLTNKLGALLTKAAGEKRETPQWTIAAVTPDKLPTKIEARAANRTPLPLGEVAKAEDFAAIDFDKRYNDLFPIPSTVKAIKLDPVYDARLRFTPAAENAATASPAGVTMTGTARLEGDPREASFPCKGLLEDGILTVDAATKAAFASYLSALQVAQAAKIQIPGLASDWKVRTKSDFKGGEKLPIEIADATGTVLATTEAAWAVDALEYTLDPAALKTSRTAAVRAAVVKPESRKPLLDAIASKLPSLTPAAGAPGAAYFGQLKAIDVAPAAGGPADSESAQMTVTLATAADAAPEDKVAFSGTVGLADGRLVWKLDTAAVKDAIEKRLAALSADETFQERRRREVAAEVGAAAGTAKTELVKEGDAWVVRVADGEKAGDHVLSWNAATLSYDRTFKPKPQTTDIAVQLAQRLAAAAGQTGAPMDIAGLSGLLGDIATVKARDVFGSESYGPVPGLGTEPGLKSVTTSLRGLMTTPGDDQARIPNIFVEYFQTPTEIYGVAWRSDAAGTPGAPQVWLAVDSAALSKLDTAEKVRQHFANEAAGERLLGPAFGAEIAGSGGSLGLMIAPDGPLWYVRWEQVRFRSRPVADVQNLLADPTPAACTRMRELLLPKRVGDASEYRRVGIWTLPSLVCEWKRGGTPRVNVRGDAKSPTGAKTLAFNQDIGNRFTVAQVLDETIATETWDDDKRRKFRRDNIGYRFWDSGYETSIEWKERKTTSFAVILRAQ